MKSTNSSLSDLNINHPESHKTVFSEEQFSSFSKTVFNRAEEDIKKSKTSSFDLRIEFGNREMKQISIVEASLQSCVPEFILDNWDGIQQKLCYPIEYTGNSNALLKTVDGGFPNTYLIKKASHTTILIYVPFDGELKDPLVNANVREEFTRLLDELRNKIRVVNIEIEAHNEELKKTLIQAFDSKSREEKERTDALKSANPFYGRKSNQAEM